MYSNYMRFFFWCIVFLLSLADSVAVAQSNESNDLYSRAVEYYRAGKYSDAEPVFAKVAVLDSIYFKQQPTTRVAYGKIWQAACLYHMGREADIDALGVIYYDLEPVDRRLTVTSDRYSDQGEKAMADGNTDMAEMYYRWAAEAEIQELGNDHYYVGNSYMALARTNILKGDFPKAVEYASKAEKIYKKITTKFNNHVAEIAQIKASGLWYDGKTDKALEEALKSYDIVKGHMSTSGYVYNEVVGLLANIYSYKGDGESFRSICSSTIDEYRSLPLSLREQGAYIPLSVIDAILHMGGYAEADSIADYVLEFVENADARYAFLQRKADIAVATGFAQAALETIDGVISYYKDRLMIPDENLYECYFIKAKALNMLRRYDEAFAEAKKTADACNLRRRELFKEYCMVHELMSDIHFGAKRFDDALDEIDVIERAMTDAKADIYDFAHINRLRAKVYENTGRLSDSRNSYLKAVECYEKSGCNLLDQNYFDCMLRLASQYGSENPVGAEAIIAKLRSIASAGNDDLSRRLLSAVDMALSERQLYFGNTKKALDGMKDTIENSEGSVTSSMLDGFVYASVQEGKFDEAADAAVRSAQQQQERYGENSSEYALALMQLAHIRAYQIDIEGMQEILDKVERIISVDGNRKGIDYAMTCLAFGECRSISGDYSGALEYIERADSMLLEYNADELMKVNTYLLKSSCLLGLGRNDEATALARKAVDVALSEWKTSNAIPKLMNQLAGCLNASGDMKGALEWYRKAYNSIPAGDENSGTILKMMILNGMVPLLNSMGLHDEAARMSAEYINCVKTKISAQHAFYAGVIVDEAYRMYRDNRLDEAVEMLMSSLAGQKGTEQKLSATTLNLECEILSFLNNTGYSYRALQLGKEYYRETEGTLFNNSMRLLLELSRAAQLTGHYDESLAYLDEIFGKGYEPGINKFDDIQLNAYYAKAYEGVRDRENALKYYRRSFDAARNFVLSNFLSMSADERRMFWNDNFNFFRHEVPVAARMADYDDRFAELAYNSTLFSTSLLLQSEKTISTAVNESGDKKMRKLYEAYLSAKAMFDNAVEKSATNVGPLRKNMDSAEEKLLAALKDRMGNYNEGLAVRWNDVMNSLADGEAAVEFVEFRLDERYSIYDAMVVRPGYELPKMRHLFVYDEEEKPFDNCYDDSRLTDRLWKPLSELLDGCTRVWFAPQGRLTTIAIESLPGLASSTKYCRLTSTRELVTASSRKVGNGAAVYGGIDYKMDSDNLISDSRSYHKEHGRSRGNIFRYVFSDNDSTRKVSSGISMLPGTLHEAEMLTGLLESGRIDGKKINVSLHTGRKGTETSFKNLDGSNVRIVHIGTHGFYFSDKDAARYKYFKRLNSIEKPIEELAMLRSGLLFAGAQGPFCYGIELPDDVDDGILTASEIAAIDFTGLDLTVLSACESALGDIAFDGVFGLQRGFKKAGAGAIMMSLWKVDDEATSVLMSEFYSRWISGMSKYDALEMAKNKVKSNEKWKSSRYWAAFILLDGIEKR